jgi:hypothetical protein
LCGDPHASQFALDVREVSPFLLAGFLIAGLVLFLDDRRTSAQRAVLIGLEE